MSFPCYLSAGRGHIFFDTILGDGIRVANVSDPASGRGDGEARVTRSHHNPAKEKWMAKIFFPLGGNRGETECEWRREGDSLRIRSHDKFKTPEGTFHGYADLRLKKAQPTL